MNPNVVAVAVLSAFLAGRLLAAQPVWLSYAVGIGIAWLAWRLFRVRGLKSGEMPRYGSNAWAEALHRAGMISDEELEGYRRQLKILPPE